MKNLLLLAGLLGAAHLASAQRHPKVFKDSAGVTTTYESYWGSIIEGRYKSARDKVTNMYSLVPLPEAEFAQEKAATAKRSIATKKLGQSLPAFRATDYCGRVFDSERLKGKVLVLNFWFVGCGPCEMEMASLNKVRAAYQPDSTVVFLSFVRSRREEVDRFLVNSPFLYPIATLDATLQGQFKPSAYPTNLVIDKQGEYAFESIGAGVGSTALLAAAIRQAAQGSK